MSIRFLKSSSIFALLSALAFAGQAADVPPAEQLLPSDTVAVLTIPSWERIAQFNRESPMGKLWVDPALKAFKDNFLNKLSTEALKPFEAGLGLQLGQYAELLRGQVTLAIFQGEAGNGPLGHSYLLLIDSKDKRNQVEEHLAQLKRKWIDAGNNIKSERIQGVEIDTVVLGKGEAQAALQKLFPGQDEDEWEDQADPSDDEQKLELSFGLSGSLLLAGNDPKQIQKVLIRQAGGGLPPLADQAAFQANRAMFRDALSFGWVNFQPVYQSLVKNFEASLNGDFDESPFPSPERLLGALGLGDITTLAFTFKGDNQGSSLEAFLGAPENRRQGLLKIIAPESKEAAPPPFVPADAVKFNRWRIDGQAAWATLEGMLNKLSPEMGGMLQFMFANAGKDQDPNFDLKRSLIGNLGDDFITFEKKPRSTTVADLNSPPSLMLIGSPNPEEFAIAMKTALSMFLPFVAPDEDVQEREFLGRKVYTLSIPLAPGLEESVRSSFNFAATASYLAASSDVALLEEYLRGSESPVKPLRETHGLFEAAEKVGGMSTGMFGYENQRESLRAVIQTLKTDRSGLEKLMQFGAGSAVGGEENGLFNWLDFSLLPAADVIAQYFHFVVYSANATRDGLVLKVYGPNPPGLR